jgi:hypothetical protein
MVKMYRQGDILLKKIETIPVGVQPSNDDVILRGEATGHAHRIVNGTIFTRSRFPTEEMYVEAKVGAALIHEEHSTIPIEPGFYEVIRQREYDPKSQSRFVED